MANLENSRVLTQAEQTEIWNALLTRVEKLKEVLEEIEPIDDYAANYLERAFTKEIPDLERLAEEVLTANEIRIR